MSEAALPTVGATAKTALPMREQESLHWRQ